MTRKGERFRWWTPEEHARMMELVGKGYSYDAVADALGRTKSAVKQRHHDYKDDGGFRRTHAEAREQAAEDRKTSAAPSHTSITSAIFGDPLPGRSALDKRRESARAISLGGDR